ncbi:MAG: hypothetical protein K9G65_06035 [Rickettsiaceae bacterium]|nr:hypothetical protein [Rickettsiaceae bacterium]
MTKANNTKTNSAINNSNRPRFLVGSDDFAKLLFKSDIFVDKSLLIKDLIEDSGDLY